MVEESLLIMKRKHVRSTWIALNIVSILLTIFALIGMILLGIYAKYDGVKIVGFGVFLPLVLIDVIFFTILIGTKKLKVRNYELKGRRICIYAGFRDHILLIDGKEVENYPKYHTKENIVWNCDLGNDKLRIEISPYNNIYVVLNGTLYKDK